MLSLDCEITIPPKVRNLKQEKQEEEEKREIIKEQKQKVRFCIIYLILGLPKFYGGKKVWFIWPTV